MVGRPSTTSQDDIVIARFFDFLFSFDPVAFVVVVVVFILFKNGGRTMLDDDSFLFVGDT